MKKDNTLEYLFNFYCLGRVRLTLYIQKNDLNSDEIWKLIEEEILCWQKEGESFDASRYNDETIKELAGVYELAVKSINQYIEDNEYNKEKSWKLIEETFSSKDFFKDLVIS